MKEREQRERERAKGERVREIESEKVRESEMVAKVLINFAKPFACFI
jgi:hypothetical protein